MRPLGIVSVFIGILLLRAAARGRALTDIPTDATDFVTSLVKGNTAGAAEAFNRAGTLSLAPEVSVQGARGNTLGEGSANGRILAEAQRLGSAAKGYRWGSAGPDWYDCSGLVYATLKSLGIYKGARFTSATVPIQAKSILTEIASPVPGCVIVWRRPTRGHVAISMGGDECYSAKSPKSGIGPGKNIWFTELYGKPRFFAVKGA